MHYTFSHHSYRLVRCADCHLLLMNPQPSDAELVAIYSESYFLGDDTPEGHQRVSQMKRATARLYLRQLARYRGYQGGSLLEIGCGQGEFLVEAQRVGYDVTGVEISVSAARKAHTLLGGGKVICGEIDSVALSEGSFDVCVLSDVIEHIRNPVEFLRIIYRLLKPGGVLFIATPSLSSWSARLLRQNWMEFKPEHLTYFDTNTIQHALYQTDYSEVVVQSGWKVLNFGYVAHHFERFQVPVLTPLIQKLARLTPAALRDMDVRIVASGMATFARTKAHVQKRTLSVIVPAYNEAATFEALMEALLLKEVPDLDLEIIVVESNSTDGTREIAQRYKDHPRVRLVLQDRPQGKGYAVRTGFQHATGDFILIQDADLEYDLEDYDALLEPLVQGRKAFVLGSRHGGNAWKMRRFADQLVLSTALNGGHWFFTTLVNLLFRQRLKDPFTMYKVFRRDCLYGLTFECNRFDFDYELLIKLVKKGYRPLEIPVNYRSRSFKEGKKVSVFRDPLTWFRALIKLRLSRIDPLRTVEEQRAKQIADLNTRSTYEGSY
jgi:glycosyltransferase involved in cell wall biosynthesis/2-polyprenyl-3-methyl-5-hydroxy-6-metoxy-1,4-benzoquinol methylase